MEESLILNRFKILIFNFISEKRHFLCYLPSFRCLESPLLHAIRDDHFHIKA